MSQPPAPPNITYTDAQRREAADWFVVIRAESDPKAESFKAWLCWMDQDEGNRAAFDAITHLWHDIPDGVEDVMPNADESQVDRYNGDQSIEEWLAGQATANATAFNSMQATSPSRHWHRAWLVAASLLVAGVGLAIMNHLICTRRVPMNSPHASVSK